ncbi:unnamed protein product [Cylicocyclus nassatus]|uniref:G-protein coupled receptors family 1 profile domain-containing protein n=1 Tax=Cylicocyclus nassatus TaxID=53992 RepID=A0AA36MBP5_CYLNA|nr:unnamed protein product [Cylicocyclus nassatus]
MALNDTRANNCGAPCTFTTSTYRAGAYRCKKGAADILSLLTCNCFACLRAAGIANSFFWKYRHVLANAIIAINFYSISVRCFGITLISVHRYVSICTERTLIHDLMEKIPLTVLAVVQWIAALIAVTPSMTLLNATFTSEETVTLEIDPRYLRSADLAAFMSAITSAVISLICYIFVLIHVKRCAFGQKSYAFRLTFQISGLILALLLVFLFYMGRYLPNLWEVSSLPSIYVALNAILSCIHPWTYFIFNGEVRRKVMNTAKCKGDAVNTQRRQTITITVPPASRT